MESGPLTPLPPSGRLEPSRDTARREQGSGGRRQRRRRKERDEEPLAASLRARLAESGADGPPETAAHDSRSPGASAPASAGDAAEDEERRGRRIDIRV